MGWVTAVASVAAAQQASALGKYNQRIMNRNAQVKEQEAEAIKQQTEFDIAKFDKSYQQLVGSTKVAAAVSGAERSGSVLNVLRYNAEQAETEKESASIFSSKCFTIEVFPAPDGADITMSFPTKEYLIIVP